MKKSKSEAVKRLDYLDMAKGIGIILVVLGHSAYVPDSVLTWIASFHMPLFFVITGILLENDRNQDKKFSLLIKKKLKSIMVPYLWFSGIYLCMDGALLLLSMGSKTWLDFFYGLIGTVTCYGISTLWFLPALFLGELIFLLVRRNRNHMITVIIGICFMLVIGITHPIFDAKFPLYNTLWNLILGYVLIWLYRSMAAYVFIMAGYYCKRYFLREKGSGVNGKELAFGIGLLFLGAAVGFANGRVDLHSVIFKNNFYFYTGALSGSMAVILICRNIRALKLLAAAGRNSLIIMATHLDFRVMLIAIKISGMCSSKAPALLQQPLEIAGVCILVFGMEYLLIFMINHFFPFILGKKSYFFKKRKFHVVE